MARGMSDIFNLPGHSKHVFECSPGFAFQPAGLCGTSARLPEEGTIGYSVDADHAFARTDKVLNGVFGYLAPPRAVVVIHQDVVVGQRRSRDANHFFLELYV